MKKPRRRDAHAGLIQKGRSGLRAEAFLHESPRRGDKAAFESPKVAAHGDLACTAAMQLAKPLKLNPRQVAESLRDSLLAKAPAFQRWVDAIEIAGPGFLNIRLKPAAKQANRARSAGGRRGSSARSPPSGKAHDGRVRLGQPDRPAARGPRPPGALGDAICNLFATQGWDVWREFYYNDAGVQIATLATSTQLRAKGFKPGDAGWPEAAYNGDYIQDIADDFLAKKTVKSDDREFTASGDVDDLDGIRQFAVAYLRHEQDLDLQAFGVKFDNYYLESSLYTSGQVDAVVQKLRDAGKTYEQDGALWLKSTDYGDDKDRVMRKSDGSYTYFVPDVAYHIAKWERGFGKVLNIQGMDHHGTIARVRAGLQAAGVGIPAGLPRLRAAHHGARDARRRGGQDLQARRQLRHAARPDRVDQRRRGALLPAQPQARHRIRLRHRPGAGQEQREPGVLRAVRACAHLLGAGDLGRQGGDEAA
jgi:arginyl-tRNA synthetase